MAVWSDYLPNNFTNCNTSFFLSSSFLFFSSLICAKRCFFLSSSAFISLLSDMVQYLCVEGKVGLYFPAIYLKGHILHINVFHWLSCGEVMLAASASHHKPMERWLCASYKRPPKPSDLYCINWFIFDGAKPAVKWYVSIFWLYRKSQIMWVKIKIKNKILNERLLELLLLVS